MNMSHFVAFDGSCVCGSCHFNQRHQSFLSCFYDEYNLVVSKCGDRKESLTSDFMVVFTRGCAGIADAYFVVDNLHC